MFALQNAKMQFRNTFLTFSRYFSCVNTAFGMHRFSLQKLAKLPFSNSVHIVLQSYQ